MRPSPYFGSVVPDSGLAGWGSVTKSVRKVVKAPVKIAQKVAKPVVKILPTPVRKAIAIPGKIYDKSKIAQLAVGAGTGILTAGATLAKPLGSTLKTVGTVAGAVVGIKPKAGGGGAETAYADANGNPISKAEYDKLMAGGSAAPVYQDENGKPISKEEYERRLAELNAPAAAQPAVEPPPAGSEGPVAVASASAPSAPSGGGGGDAGGGGGEDSGPAASAASTEEPSAPEVPPTAAAQAEPGEPEAAPMAVAAPRSRKGVAIGVIAGVAVLGLVAYLALRKKG